MRSVEFYDVATGQWVSLPPLVTGRRGHSMMVQAGRMMVVGGMAHNNTYLSDMEVFNGERSATLNPFIPTKHFSCRWIKSSKELRTGRQGFAVVKIPIQRLIRKLRIPRKKKQHRV